MSKLTDKASYIKGLAAGMKLNMEKDSNKLLAELLELVSDMAEELEVMGEAHEELNEYVESIDDDLADLEETLFGEDEMDGEDEDFTEGDEEDERALAEIQEFVRVAVLLILKRSGVLSRMLTQMNS